MSQHHPPCSAAVWGELGVAGKQLMNKNHNRCLCSRCADVPLFAVSIAVAVVLGVRAVPVDATGALLDAGPRAPPVEVLLAAPANPPCVRGPIWGEKKYTHTKSATLKFLSKKKKTGSRVEYNDVHRVSRS